MTAVVHKFAKGRVVLGNPQLFLAEEYGVGDGFLPATDNSMLHPFWTATLTLDAVSKIDTLVLTYVFSWRTKELKLLCLKCLGSSSEENAPESQTMKLHSRAV